MVSEAIDWGLAERVAVRLAGTDPFQGSYHFASLQPDFDELTAEAEALVGAATGLHSLLGPARARVADRQDWVRANIASFQRLLRPITSVIGEHLRGPMAPVARRAAGLEVGSLLGWMSARVLGQYDLLVIEDEQPEEQDLVYYIGPNVLALEKRYAFPPREFRLWLALHEVTHRAQFTGVPWMRKHFLGLVHQTLGSADPDPKRLLEAIKRAADQVRAGRNPLDDGGIVTLLASPDQRVAIDAIGGLMSLLEGHGDVTMDRAGAHLIASADRFSRVLRQRRDVKGVAKTLRKLVGIEAKMAQYEQGEKFIAAVEAARGPDFLNRVWSASTLVPTLAEIRDPFRWMDRVESSGVPHGALTTVP